MTTKDITGVVTWLKGWFYDKGEVNGYLNSKLNNNLTNANMNVVTDSSGNVVTEAKPTPYSHPSTHATSMIKEASALANIGTSANATQHDVNDAINTALNTKLNSNLTNANMNVVTDSNGNVITEAKPTPYSHPSTHATTIIKEGSALSNIGTSANATQHDINDAINTALGQLKGVDIIKVVSDKGTASADTMNKLYIVSENNKVNIYYTKEVTNNGTTSYEWQKMDSDILDELTVSWNDIQNKPSSYTPSSHAVNANTYGLGTTGVYGHVKTVNGLTTSSHSDGLSLSAYQGYVLNNAKSDKSVTVTDIELVPKSTDNTGAIKLIFADE